MNIQINKTTKHKTTKHKTYSSSICNLSSNLISSLTQKTLHNKYKAHISTTAHKFIQSQQQLLNELFKLKIKNNFTFTFTEHVLDNQTNIPPFIEMFRYLLTKPEPEFINKLSQDEQKYLQESLSPNNTIKQCYNLINKFKIGDKLIEAYNSIIQSSSIKNELIVKFPSITFHSLLINSFTSFRIIEDLELNIAKLYCFSVVYNGKPIDNLIYLFMYKDFLKGKIPDIYLEKIGQDIIKRLLFFNNLLNINTLPNKLIIFLTNKKKTIDDNVILHQHFKTININTAVTNGQDIIIYREQELLKSIFHELIHFHNLDFRQIPPEIITYLIKTHNIKPDNTYLLYECVTEALANILNNIFLSRNIIIFEKNLKEEILFSTLQVAKILNVCKYINWTEFARIDKSITSSNMSNSMSSSISSSMSSNMNNMNSNPKKHFKQDSCVMSYYILKFYILFNLDTYFRTCLDTKLKFIQTKESFNNLINIFDISRNDLILKSIMDNILNNLILNKNKLKSLKNLKINKTLRMTCLESNLFMKNSI